jgi:hypothetical protein
MWCGARHGVVETRYVTLQYCDVLTDCSTCKLPEPRLRSTVI